MPGGLAALRLRLEERQQWLQVGHGVSQEAHCDRSIGVTLRKAHGCGEPASLPLTPRYTTTPHACHRRGQAPWCPHAPTVLGPRTLARWYRSRIARWNGGRSHVEAP